MTLDKTVGHASLDRRITIYQTKWDCFLTAMLLRIKFSWFGKYSWFSKICDEPFEDLEFRNNCEFRYYPVIFIKMGCFEISLFFEITVLFRNNRLLSKQFFFRNNSIVWEAWQRDSRPRIQPIGSDLSITKGRPGPSSRWQTNCREDRQIYIPTQDR
jgi:hypothetical protein